MNIIREAAKARDSVGDVGRKLNAECVAVKKSARYANPKVRRR
jgi:hypothetical protein